MDVGVVIAVVVTFNRKELVVQTLAALKGQTHCLDRIVLVDNASTDGTEEFLRARGVLDDAQIVYVRSEKNTGGAGGFHMGMARAMELGANWVWVMDDDVAPMPDCLACLLSYRDISECIHPRKFFPNGAEYQSEQFHDVLTGGRYGLDNLSFKNGKKVIFNNTATFEGILVSRRLLENVGLPDEKYFINGDDMIFGLKASVHTNIAHVSDAVIKRLLDVSAMAPWKSYYFLRNRFFLFRDACEYLEIRPGFFERTKFIVIQTLDFLRLLNAGPKYFRPALSGYIDGLRYMRKL